MYRSASIDGPQDLVLVPYHSRFSTKGSQKVGQMILQTKLQIKKTSACVRDLTSQEFSISNQYRLVFLLFYLSFDLPAPHVVADKLAH